VPYKPFRCRTPGGSPDRRCSGPSPEQASRTSGTQRPRLRFEVIPAWWSLSPSAPWNAIARSPTIHASARRVSHPRRSSICRHRATSDWWISAMRSRIQRLHLAHFRGARTPRTVCRCCYFRLNHVGPLEPRPCRLRVLPKS
jgi:hypothetical protein